MVVVECASGVQRTDLSEPLRSLCWKAFPRTMHCVARGVSFDRLPAILRNGCDVEPVNSAIYASSDLNKALEYGTEDDQVVQFFQADQLTATYREVEASIPDVELAELRKTYPTLIRSTDGARLWLSRLGEDDRRIATDYEIEYARWIPGDPFNALAVVVILGADFYATMKRTVLALNSTTNKRWRLDDDVALHVA